MTPTHLDLDRIEGLAGRLRADAAHTGHDSDWFVEHCLRVNSAASDLTAMITRIRELEEALEPFAALADDYLTDTVNFDDDTIMAGRMTRRGEEGSTPPRVTFADFRRARTALQRKTP